MQFFKNDYYSVWLRTMFRVSTTLVGGGGGDCISLFWTIKRRPANSVHVGLHISNQQVGCVCDWEENTK